MSHAKHRRRAWKHALLTLVALVGVVYLFMYQAEQRERSTLLAVHFENPSGQKSPTYWLEIAANEQARATGLMYRKEMDSDRGMLFIFDKPELHSFYMKNTFISLDMIFLDEKHTVVGLIENVPVLNEEKRAPGKLSQHVIELNAGEAKKAGIKEGSIAKYARALPKAS